MNLSPKTLILLAAVAALPLANATWMAYGTYEPNTPYDTPQFMFADPPLETGRVYFNAITSTQYVTSNGKPSISPNVGLLRTHIEPTNIEFHNALFGVWLDCNGDGYVGMAEGALREYDARLLLDSTICPPMTGSAQTWTPGAHNYRGIVSEFIPIARHSGGNDTRVYIDNEAHAWGDFHRPDERPFHRSCALNPQPRGTWSSTGGILNYADCRQDIMGNANVALDLLGDPLGLRFANEDDARSGPLGQIETLGTEDSAHSPVYLVDCSAGNAFHSGDFLNNTAVGPSAPTWAQNTTIPTLDPRLGNTQNPTAPGAINATNEELAGDCDTSNDRGADTYGLLEDDFNGVDPNNKVESDWNFGFLEATRGPFPQNIVPGWSSPTGMHADGGIGWGGSRWVSDSTWASKPGPRSIRIDLGSGNAGIAPAYWLSFYAHVSGATTQRGLQLPSASPGIYGAWHCGENDSGIHNGWNCDKTKWYINPDGSAIPDPFGHLARPGLSYQLRDVDCYDGRIGDTGVGVQPAYYGSEPCP